MSAEAAAPAPAAQAAPAPAAPPAPPPVPEGLSYRELSELLAVGTEKSVKQNVVGQTVLLNLARARGRNAPAGTYTAENGDPVFFRCRAVAGGFTGGEVTTKVQDLRFVARTKQKILDLERCSPTAAEPARAAAAPAPAPATAPAPAAPQPAPAPRTGGPAKPGMDAQGNVLDSSKVEAGSGRTVKGLNEYEGEITGNPAANSKFTRLQIGMPVRQVTDLAGPPTDQGAYITGKAWIPFYFGADRHRFEMTYKGQGRLIFAGGGMGDFGSGYLIWIIHNPNEPGYR
ncbi:hypothetical protein [Variovorax sp. PBL-H6]|uniref:hypothetical protein n=1 Tax=Variovorax sp. PBL-H6 TaxID=434009 RepID=UPI001E50F7FA|nr:hypothetical protein [Variovorax sp. PBL-H6]